MNSADKLALAREAREQEERERQQRRAERREENSFRNKRIITIAVLAICVSVSIVAQILGHLLFSNFMLIVSQIGFYLGLVAIVAVIVTGAKGRLRYRKWGTLVILLTLALVGISCFSIFGGLVQVKSYLIDEQNGVVYAEMNKQYTVWKLKDGYENVVIRASGEGKLVGEVRGLAARSNSSVVSITFEDGASMKIANNAFNGCSRLTDVTLGSNSTYTIGKKAFAKCLKLTTFDCGDGSSITVKKNAFAECPSLEKFDVGSSKVVANEASGDFMPIFGWKTNATLYVDGGSISYLSDQVGGLVVGNKSRVEISAAEAYNGNPIKLNVAQAVFQDGFNFTDSTLLNENVVLSKFKWEHRIHPFGDTIYLPASITYIPDNFFGNDGASCKVFFAGTEAQWNALSIGSEGNSNYTDGKVDVVFNTGYNG